MKKIVFIATLLFISNNSIAGFISYTGKYKIHDDKCYQQVIRQPSKLAEWEEFDCVVYLEDMHINEAILNNVKMFYDFMKGGQVSEKAYMEILDASMSAISQKSYFNKKTIMANLQDAIKEAQKKYPTK